VEGCKGRKLTVFKLETSDLSPRYFTIGQRGSPGLQSGGAEKRICKEKDTEAVKVCLRRT
jgi:hypothetical protein